MRILDHAPVLVLAVLAFAGSFTHISHTAIEHGQDGWMAVAIAVSIDLVCVVAARERQRDRRLGRRSLIPTLVLVGGVLLSLAANLAQAEPSVWGWVMAGTPCAAFVTAVGLIERRGGQALSERACEDEQEVVGSSEDLTTEVASPLEGPATDVPEGRLSVEPEPAPVKQAPKKAKRKASPKPPQSLAELLILAQQADQEHRQAHGRRISRDKLRVALGVSTGTASQVLRELKTA